MCRCVAKSCKIQWRHAGASCVSNRRAGANTELSLGKVWGTSLTWCTALVILGHQPFFHYCTNINTLGSAQSWTWTFKLGVSPASLAYTTLQSVSVTQGKRKLYSKLFPLWEYAPSWTHGWSFQMQNTAQRPGACDRDTNCGKRKTGSWRQAKDEGGTGQWKKGAWKDKQMKK